MFETSFTSSLSVFLYYIPFLFVYLKTYHDLVHFCSFVLLKVDDISVYRHPNVYTLNMWNNHCQCHLLIIVYPQPHLLLSNLSKLQVWRYLCFRICPPGRNNELDWPLPQLHTDYHSHKRWRLFPDYGENVWYWRNRIKYVLVNVMTLYENCYVYSS